MFRRCRAEQKQKLRLNKLDLPHKEWPADQCLLRRRCPVTRWTPVDDVGDVDVRLAEPNGRQHLIKQLPGAADNRLALEVLLTPGSLADDHDASCGRPTIEAQVLGRRTQGTPLEPLQCRP